MYQPFLKHLEQSLFERFELQPRPIPQELEQRVSERGRSSCHDSKLVLPMSRNCAKFATPILMQAIALKSLIASFILITAMIYRYLGIDFLSFGKVKNLIVLDFQPLFQDEEYLTRYIKPLQAIHDSYPDLAQDLEMKFYDANQYFSKYLIFAKTDPETIATRFFDCFKDYLNLYWQLLDHATPSEAPEDLARIQTSPKRL